MKIYIQILRIGVLTFFIALAAQFAHAQTNKADTAQARAYYEQAKKLMEAGKFNQAEILFVKIFKMDVLLPDEICYHYGKTLFELKKYPQSKNFIEKYLRLQGEKGYYFLHSLQIELDIEKATNPNAPQICEKIVKDTCHLCHGSGNALQSCTRCEGHGRIVCDLCQGNKVNIESSSFGERYFTCSRCNGSGVAGCPLCEGTKMEKRNCENCRGKRFAIYKRRC